MLTYSSVFAMKRTPPASQSPIGWLFAVGALVAGCGSGEPAAVTERGQGRAPAARSVVVDAPPADDGGGAATQPAPTPTEPAVFAALVDAIARDDGRALADLVDPEYGLTLYGTQGFGSGYTVLDAIAVGETTAPSRRPRRAPPGAPPAWAASGWRGVAAAMTVGLSDLSVEPPDTSIPTFGFCRGEYGLRGDGAPLRAYLRRDRDDRDMHLFDTPDHPPRVPPLSGLTVIGTSRLQVSLRRSPVGWRAVHVVVEDRCRGVP